MQFERLGQFLGSGNGGAFTEDEWVHFYAHDIEMTFVEMRAAAEAPPGEADILGGRTVQCLLLSGACFLVMSQSCPGKFLVPSSFPSRWKCEARFRVFEVFETLERVETLEMPENVHLTVTPELCK